MSRSVLHRIAIGHGWKPEEWHFKLADKIGANAVLMIFRHAKVSDRDGGKELMFPERQTMLAAVAYTKDAERVFGCRCEMKSPVAQPPRRVIRQDNWRVK